MKKILCITAIITVWVLKAHSQGNVPEFGKIDKADLQMKECAFDKSADAAVLINTGKASFELIPNNGATIVTERRIRIKIFTEKGFSAASISIPFVNKSQFSKISDIEAYVYNLDDNGNIVTQKLDNNELFKDKSNVKRSSASIRFTFPNLKKGSVIEYRYTKTQKEASSISAWLFQDELPTVYSNYTIVLNGDYNIKHHIISPLQVEIDSVIKTYARSMFNKSTWSFTLRNVAAFKLEPFMTPLADNLQRVEFLLVSYDLAEAKNTGLRWGRFSARLLVSPYFGRQAQGPLDESTDFFIDSVLTLKTVHEKIDAAFEYVKRNVVWNEEQTFVADDVVASFRNKSGSSADMNLLLLNILRRCKVKSYPLLVSTRENGKPDENFPSLSQFDGVGVLAYDENETAYVLDCTQKQLSYKIPPYKIINRRAFLVDYDISQWVNVNVNKPLITNAVSINADVDSTGNVTGSSYIILTNLAKLLELDDSKENSKNWLGGSEEPGMKIDSLVKLHDKDNTDTLIKKFGNDIQFYTKYFW